MSHTLQCSAAEGGAYAFWAYFARLVDVLETGVISVCWLSESRLPKLTHETGASQLTTPCQHVRALPAHSLRSKKTNMFGTFNSGELLASQYTLLTNSWIEFENSGQLVN
jgi:hypothetical protein